MRLCGSNNKLRELFNEWVLPSEVFRLGRCLYSDMALIYLNCFSLRVLISFICPTFFLDEDSELRPRIAWQIVIEITI